MAVKLPEESVRKFQVAYKEAYGEEISFDEASEMAHALSMLYERLYSPLPSERNTNDEALG